MPAMHTRPMLLALFSLTCLTLPATGLAKGPTRREVDEVLLRLPADAVEGVRQAEIAVGEGELRVETVQAELDVAWLDARAAGDWLDAARAVLQAVEADQKAAQKGHRTEQEASLASQMVRARASLAWRDARDGAAKEEVAYRQARLVWAKAEQDRLVAALELARMQAFDGSRGGDSVVQQEVGRLQAKLGRAAEIEARERHKMDRAEAIWRERAARAAPLAPAQAAGE